MGHDTANNTIVLAKITPPQLSKAIRRERLALPNLEKQAYKVITVIAPAGYGKSVLMSQWYQQLISKSHFKAWLNVDKTDNDSKRLVSGLVTALNSHSSLTLKHSSQIIASGPGYASEMLMNVLLKELEELEQPIVMFIDDAHLLTIDKAKELLKEFIHQSSPYVAFVLGSRHKLKLNLSRIKLKGTLREYRLDDLCFTESESSQFINHYHQLDLDTSQIQVINDYCEGWPAGMQLTALSLQEQNDKQCFINDIAKQTNITNDYLEETVFTAQTEKVQNFLLKTAILDQFNIELCQQLTGYDDMAAILAELQRKNLFLIQLDNQNEWFRYHHLFQAYLVKKGQQQLGKEVQKLYQIASRWFEEKEMFTTATRYALDGKNLRRGVKLISLHGDYIISRLGDYESLIKEIERLPKKYLEKYPQIRLVLIYAIFYYSNLRSNVLSKSLEQMQKLEAWIEQHRSDATNNNLEQIERNLQFFKCWHAMSNDQIELGYQLSKAWIKKYQQSSIVLANNLSINLPVAAHYQQSFKQAKESIEQYQQLHRRYQNDVGKNLCFSHKLNMSIAILYISQGKFNRAKNELIKVMSFYESGTVISHPNKGVVQLNLLIIDWEQGNIVTIKPYKNLILLMAKSFFADIIVLACRLLAKYTWINGDIKKSDQFLLDGIEHANKLGLKRVVLELSALRIKLYLMSGRLEAAMEIAKENDLLNAQNYPLPAGWEGWYDDLINTTRLRLNIATNSVMSSDLSMVDRLITKMDKLSMLAEKIRLLIIKARVLLQLGHEKKAIATLQEVIILGASERYVMAFVEECQLIKNTLKTAIDTFDYQQHKQVSIEYTQTILNFLGYNQQSSTKQYLDYLNNPHEPLTKREQEILHRLLSPVTNKAIADQLFISETTLKWHLRNLYSKLGVKTRIAAVNKAKEIELIKAA